MALSNEDPNRHHRCIGAAGDRRWTEEHLFSGLTLWLGSGSTALLISAVNVTLE